MTLKQIRRLACDCAGPEYHQTGNPACAISILLAKTPSPAPAQTDVQQPIFDASRKLGIVPQPGLCNARDPDGVLCVKVVGHEAPEHRSVRIAGLVREWCAGSDNSTLTGESQPLQVTHEEGCHFGRDAECDCINQPPSVPVEQARAEYLRALSEAMAGFGTIGAIMKAVDALIDAVRSSVAPPPLPVTVEAANATFVRALRFNSNVHDDSEAWGAILEAKREFTSALIAAVEQSARSPQEKK